MRRKRATFKDKRLRGTQQNNKTLKYCLTTDYKIIKTQT